MGEDIGLAGPKEEFVPVDMEIAVKYGLSCQKDIHGSIVEGRCQIFKIFLSEGSGLMRDLFLRF